MLTTLVWMFAQVGIDKNLGKTKLMTCMIGFIWGNIGNKAYTRKAVGER